MPECSYVCMQCVKTFHSCPVLSKSSYWKITQFSVQENAKLDLNALKDPTVSNAQFVSELFPEKNCEKNENEDEEMSNEKIDEPDVEDIKIPIN